VAQQQGCFNRLLCNTDALLFVLVTVGIVPYKTLLLKPANSEAGIGFVNKNNLLLTIPAIFATPYLRT
jgi:hypothetical protein